MCSFDDALVVIDLCRCALSMRSLYLTSVNVLVVLDHGYADNVNEKSASKMHVDHLGANH